METQENHPELGKVVFDTTLKQFALLTKVYRENEFSAWHYVCEYADSKTRERFCSEIEMRPVRFALIVG